MSRPTRLRRPPAKYAKEETPPKAEVKPPVPQNPQKNSEKVRNDPLNALRSPVLRDRTNLTVELVKIDIKKATDDKDPGKMPKDPKKPRETRKTVQSMKSPEKSGNSGKNKNSDDKLKKIVKRQLPPRSSKNPGVQVTEEEPLESPDVPKPPKVPKSSKMSEKRDLPPKNPSKPLKTSSKPKKSTKTSLPINKPPKSPAKSPKKSEKRSSKRLATKSTETQKEPKKIFKTRKIIPSTHSKVSPMKRALKNPRKLPPKKKSDSYQPTLKESFARAKKILRPRKIVKNYTENSGITENKELIDNNEERKGPVYKNIKIQEEIPKDANKIYEFSFDVNDSNERLNKKKRKKKILKKTGIKRKKIIEVSKIPDKITKNKVEVGQSKEVKIRKVEVGEVDEVEVGKLKNAKADKNKANEVEVGEVDEVEVGKSKPTKKNEVVMGEVGMYEVEVDEVELDQSKSSKKNEVEVGKVGVGPFKSAKNNEVEVGEVLKSKLRINIEKSKIKKTSDEINEVHNELTRQTSLNSLPRSSKIIEVVAEVHEAPSSPEKSSKPKIISNKKFEGEKMINLTSTPLNAKTNEVSSSNPFSNRPSSQYKGMINHSLIRRSFSPIVKETREKFDASSPWRPISSGFSRIKNVYQSTPQGRKQLTHVINSLATDNKRIAKIKEGEAEGNDENCNSRVVDNNSDKIGRKGEDNSGVKSPRKFGTVLSNVSSGSSQSPTMFRGFDNSPRKFAGDKENGDGIESPEKIKTKSFNVESEGKILRQSNLNNFLSIPGMPESATIVTSHGIFDDPHSTPITGKARRVEDFGVGNAFGFDVESTLEFSPIDAEKSGGFGGVKKVKEVRRKVEPTRLEVREVKTVEVREDGERGEEVEMSGRTKKHAEATKTDVVEAVHFLDTFDADERETSPVDVPLFVDPEPVHFRQPPRYSYSKRKRAVKFNTSDETEHSDVSDSDDNENYVKHKNKKRKMTKAEKEQKKQLEDWARSINQTFDEIEHFDLLVE